VDQVSQVKPDQAAVQMPRGHWRQTSQGGLIGGSDDGKPVHLEAGDIVVQQATRHGRHNQGDRPATIAFVMLGA
jgi:hypothetical protein